MSKRSLVEKMVKKQNLGANAVAFESLDYYKATKELLAETYLVLGKHNSFETAIVSTSNVEIKCHGQYSTTTQKI